MIIIGITGQTVCYNDHETFYPFSLKSIVYSKGSFVKVVKPNSSGFSTTHKVITRVNHFYGRKIERIAVI